MLDPGPLPALVDDLPEHIEPFPGLCEVGVGQLLEDPSMILPVRFASPSPGRLTAGADNGPHRRPPLPDSGRNT